MTKSITKKITRNLVRNLSSYRLSCTTQTKQLACLLMLLFSSISWGQVTLTATSGTATGSFTTLKGAFDAINAGTHQGNVIISINANTTETAPAVLNSSGAGLANYTALLIQPTVDGITVSGATATGRGLIELNGADNVTIDGDNPNTLGTNRNLTITNTATNTITHTSCVRIAVAATVVTSANNNAIRNLIVNGSATGRNVSTATSTTASENGSYGIYTGGNASTVAATTAPSAITSTSSSVGTGATYNNLVISNNEVNACARAIYVGGSATSVCNSLTISNNIIGSSTPNSATTVYSMGITAQGCSNGVISGNIIRSVESWLSTSIRGIDVGSISNVSGDLFSVTGNTVYNAVQRSTSGYGVYGINIVGGTGNTVANNFIYGLNNVGSGISTSFGCLGMRIGANTNHKIYHNTVHLSGTNLSATGVYFSASLVITATTLTGIDIRNNIFSNVSSANGVASSYATSIYLPSSATSTMNLTLNNNAYYTGSTAGLHGVLAVGTTYAAPYTVANFSAGVTTPTANSRSYTGPLSSAGTNDNASLAFNSPAPFVSATDLHINTGTATTFLESWGASASTTLVTTDFDGNTRPGPTGSVNGGGTAPDLGADEFDGVPPSFCSGTPTAGTIASNTTQNLCSGTVPTSLSVTGTTTGVLGITFQWESSTNNTIWDNATGGTGATTATYTPPAFGVTTLYYRCKVTCTNSSLFDVTNVATIAPPSNPTTQASNLVFSSISYTGFTATWTNGNGNRRVVYISNAPIVDPTNTTGAAALTAAAAYSGSGQQIVYDGTGTSVSVTGLTLGTAYYVEVFEYTRCGTTTFDNYYNTTAGTNATTVTTSTISPTPWSEGFATGVATFPNWQTTSGAAVGTATGLAALSPNYWYVNLYGSLTTAAVTTPIIGSIPSNYRFVVKYNLANYASPYTPPASGSGNFIVAISTDNGSSYTDVETIANSAVAGWQEYVLNLSAYTGQNIRIRLTGNRTSGDYHLAFDNFSVEAIPSCLPPNTLVLSSISNNSASLSWTAPATAPGSGYDVYYSTTNTAPTAGTTPSANVPSGTTYAFSGLTASTTYYSWVRSNCGSGDVSTWVASASFTTQCNPVSVPYSQDFESVTTPALPICTSIENAGTGNNWKTASPAGYGFTTKCLNYSYNGDNAANAWFFTAGINLTAGTSYRISYNYGSSSTGSFPENLKVAYGVAASSASMTTTLATHTNILTNSAPLSIVDFTPGTTGVYYFGFHAFSDADMDQLYVDNISIKVTPNTWTGTTSNSWNTASNWSLTTVPTATDDVLISSNGSNAPVMDVDVTIPAGKSLTLTGGELTIAPGKVLTIAGTANFGGRPVTFKSNATGTAMLGPLTTETLTGATSVTVERFIPSGKRAFRLLSPAVTTTTFISGNWQQQTHITGGASGGFDVTETNNPSMFTYNNLALSGTGWTPIANTNATNLTAGVGYRMLVRGDRTATNITTATTDNMNAAITLSATGTLKTGTVTLNASSTPAINNTANITTAGYSLVGNPYQSAVDWNAVTKSGIDATYWAWDPNMGTTAQRGRYVAFNGTTNDNVDSEVEQFIQPGQAFFVKNTTSGTAGSLTFEEADKATTSANVFRTNNQTESTNFATLSTALYDPNELAIGGYPIDATKAVFSSEYTNELGLGDATKLEAAGENIAWFRNNTKLAIDAAAPVTNSDELVMKTLRLVANKNYTFKIQTTNFDSALTPYLVDTFLNTQTEISTSQAYLATFATTSNLASYSENRFKIVFQNAVLSTDTFASQVGLYPNPSKGNGFYLQLPSSAQATVKLYNTIGQEIAISHNEGHYQANQSLAAGVYHIMVTQGEKTSKLKWIVE
jgi:hypothetical protein